MVTLLKGIMMKERRWKWAWLKRRLKLMQKVRCNYPLSLWYSLWMIRVKGILQGKWRKGRPQWMNAYLSTWVLNQDSNEVNHVCDGQTIKMKELFKAYTLPARLRRFTQKIVQMVHLLRRLGTLKFNMNFIFIKLNKK